MSFIGVIPTTVRKNNNGVGIAAWATSIVNKHPKSTLPTFVVSPKNSPYPLGPVLDPVVAIAITDPSKYSEANTREWSKLVSSFPGIIFVTSEYNGSYPGELKNALDHIYHEWTGKPVLIISYGGGGGGRSAALLKALLEGPFKMKVVDEVNIIVPREYLGGEKRVNEADAGLAADFLEAYAGKVNDGVEKLLQAVAEPLKAA